MATTAAGPGTPPDLDAFGFSSFDGFNGRLVRWRYEILARHCTGRTCLELGCSDGSGTELLLARFDTVTAVDGSARAVEDLARRHPGSTRLRPLHSYFEDLDLGERFDTVVAAHILEHVDDPVRVLQVARRHLAPGGVLIADVPNAMSLHRRLGVKLGLLQVETELAAADLSIGHQRVYTPDAFRADVEAAGFQVDHTGGIFLKLLANDQLEHAFTPEQLQGLLAVGEDLPELAAEIYVVASAP